VTPLYKIMASIYTVLQKNGTLFILTTTKSNVIFGGNVANGFVANIGLVKYISGTDENPTTQRLNHVEVSVRRRAE